MSPVCKKCRNYVMSLPCPHCGGEQEFTERNPNEIKPIIPLDLQESFQIPPVPGDQLGYNNTASLKAPSPPLPNILNKSDPVISTTAILSPPSPPSVQSTLLSHSPPLEPPREQPSSNPVVKPQISTVSPLKRAVPTFNNNSEDIISHEEVQKYIKRLESHIKQLNSKQSQYETQVHKLQLNLKEVNKKLQKYEKSVKVLSKANQKLESIHKDTAKILKKLV